MASLGRKKGPAGMMVVVPFFLKANSETNPVISRARVHNHNLGVWIPGLRLAAHPGMMIENYSAAAAKRLFSNSASSRVRSVAALATFSSLIWP